MAAQDRRAPLEYLLERHSGTNLWRLAIVQGAATFDSQADAMRYVEAQGAKLGRRWVIRTPTTPLPDHPLS